MMCDIHHKDIPMKDQQQVSLDKIKIIDQKGGKSFEN